MGASAPLLQGRRGDAVAVTLAGEAAVTVLHALSKI
jgi:hypothetical protein